MGHLYPLELPLSRELTKFAGFPLFAPRRTPPAVDAASPIAKRSFVGAALLASWLRRDHDRPLAFCSGKPCLFYADHVLLLWNRSTTERPMARSEITRRASLFDATVLFSVSGPLVVQMANLHFGGIVKWLSAIFTG